MGVRTTVDFPEDLCPLCASVLLLCPPANVTSTFFISIYMLEVVPCFLNKNNIRSKSATEAKKREMDLKLVPEEFIHSKIHSLTYIDRISASGETVKIFSFLKKSLVQTRILRKQRFEKRETCNHCP